MERSENINYYFYGDKTCAMPSQLHEFLYKGMTVYYDIEKEYGKDDQITLEGRADMEENPQVLLTWLNRTVTNIRNGCFQMEIMRLKILI